LLFIYLIFFFLGDCLSGEVKEVKEGKVRSRADLSNQIMEQLTSPLLDYSVPRNGPVETPEGKPSESSSDKSLEIEVRLIKLFLLFFF
jgi:hypothetical protein